VYIDSTERRIRVPLSTLEPVEPRALRPNVARVQSFLLVIDTLNARPGTGGEVLLKDLAFIAGPPQPPGDPKF
jgi:hypothetical protein